MEPIQRNVLTAPRTVRDVRLSVDEGRQTPPDPSFSDILASGVRSVLVAGADLAAPIVPGGTAIQAAVHSMAATAAGAATPGFAPGVPGSAGYLPAGTPEAQLFHAQELSRQRDRVFNLQYLDLQRQIQEESRQFMLVSNVMKTRHETVKTAINNLR